MIPVPISATLYLTNHCQFRCAHCFLTDSATLNTAHLATDDARQVIDDLSRAKVLMPVLSGGDPMLHTDFFDLVAHTRTRNMVPLIGINPVEYDVAALDRLLALGINNVQVSLDALTHSGAGERALERHATVLLQMIDKGFQVAVAVTVHSGNCMGCPELVQRLLAMGCARIKLALWRQTTLGRACGIRQLSEAEAADLCDRVTEHTMEHPAALTLPDLFRDAHGRWRIDETPPPRLVIRADGTIGFSETDDAVGNVQDGDVVAQYREVRARIADRVRSSLVSVAIADANVEDVWSVPREQLCAGGALIEMDARRYILVADDLSAPERFFTILHELAHLHAGTLSTSPQTSSRSVEIAANVRALDMIAPYLPTRFGHRLYALARKDEESELFKEIRTKLDAHILDAMPKGDTHEISA